MSRVNIEPIGKCETGKQKRRRCRFLMNIKTRAPGTTHRHTLTHKNVLTSRGKWIDRAHTQNLYMEKFANELTSASQPASRRRRHGAKANVISFFFWQMSFALCVYFSQLKNAFVQSEIYVWRCACDSMWVVKNGTSTNFDWILQRFVAMIGGPATYTYHFWQCDFFSFLWLFVRS